MKKFIAGLLLLLFVTALFIGGCGPSKKDAKKPTTPAAGGPATTPGGGEGSATDKTGDTGAEGGAGDSGT